MTPEERFERIETQLELVARYLTRMGERGDRNTEDLTQMGARMDQGFAELRASMDQGFAELRARMAEGFAELRARVDQTSRDVTKLADAVGILVKLFERHTGDGHGGR